MYFRHAEGRLEIGLGPGLGGFGGSGRVVHAFFIPAALLCVVVGAGEGSWNGGGEVRRRAGSELDESWKRWMG